MARRITVLFLWTSFIIAIMLGMDIGIAEAVKKDRYYFESRGDIIWEVPTKEKIIALSFDDGPNPKYTPQILDLLKQYHAKATFFVIGSRVLQYPDLARREAQEGHEIANHTYHHNRIKRLSPEELREEIEKTGSTIASVTGQIPHLFRPPGGYYDEIIVNTAKEAGYKVVMWSWHQDTRDWSQPGTDRIVNLVLSNARNGDIVLFHDHGRNRLQTVNALKQILPELQQRGYQFVTISELIQIKNSNHPPLPSAANASQ